MHVVAAAHRPGAQCVHPRGPHRGDGPDRLGRRETRPGAVRRGISGEYLGGREHASRFLATYESEGPLTLDELAHLDAFSRFREVVQGAYFAERLATNDLTGGIEHADNEKGLSDARRRWEALGPPGT